MNWRTPALFACLGTLLACLCPPCSGARPVLDDSLLPTGQSVVWTAWKPLWEQDLPLWALEAPRVRWDLLAAEVLAVWAFCGAWAAIAPGSPKAPPGVSRSA